MTVTRRNVIADANAGQEYVDAVWALKKDMRGPNRSTYDLFVAWHFVSMMTMTPSWHASRNAAHNGPSFLPWHRYFLAVFEYHLQRITNNPNFGLPYWDWAADAELSPAQQRQAPIWGSQLMGGEGDPVSTGPFAYDQDNPGSPNNWIVRVVPTGLGDLAFNGNRGLRRSFGGVLRAITLPGGDDVRDAVAISVYDSTPWDMSPGTRPSFRKRIEFPHNGVHAWIEGDMMTAGSPNDPVFFLHHANIDRMWAAWQEHHDPNAQYRPSDSITSDLAYHRLNDPMLGLDAGPTGMTPSQVLDLSALYKYDRLSDAQPLVG